MKKRKSVFIFFTWNWPKGSKLILLTYEKWRTIVLILKFKKIYNFQFIVKSKWIANKIHFKKSHQWNKAPIFKIRFNRRRIILSVSCEGFSMLTLHFCVCLIRDWLWSCRLAPFSKPRWVHFRKQSWEVHIVAHRKTEARTKRREPLREKSHNLRLVSGIFSAGLCVMCNSSEPFHLKTGGLMGN